MKRRNQVILSRLPLATVAQPTSASSGLGEIGRAVEPQVQIFNLSDALAEFRIQLERDAGMPLQDIETSAAFVLDDLCSFLGFGTVLRAKVIGQDAAILIDSFLDRHMQLVH